MSRLDPPPGLLARAVVRLASWLLPLRNEAPRPQELKRVLVVRTDDRVGNALLTIPLARALQQALPQARIDLLLARPAVAQGLPGLNVLHFDKRALRRLPALLARLRGYDAVIDAAHWHAFSLTSALLSRWATRRWLVGSERGPAYIYSRALPPPPEGMRETDAKLLLAQGLGLTLETPALETALGKGESPAAGAPYVALNPGARKLDHRWQGFSELARMLQQRMRTVIFWGPGEEPLARAVAQESGAELAPPTNLDQLASAFRAASLVITNDTGPLHLAAACGAKTLAIFLDAEGLRWSHASMESLVAPTPQEAFAAATRLLDSAAAPSDPARSREGT